MDFITLKGVSFARAFARAVFIIVVDLTALRWSLFEIFDVPTVWILLHLRKCVLREFDRRKNELLLYIFMTMMMVLIDSA